MENFIEKVIDICTVDDLMKGYVYDESHRVYTCLFCGEIFEEDLVYKCEEQLCTAKKAVEMHIIKEHGSPFDFLIGLDKKYTGLTDRQKEILEIIFSESDNKLVAEKMETTPATVRSYKFKMRENLRQSKVYLALFYLIEQKNNEDKNMSAGNIWEAAIYEKLKSIEKKIDEIGNDNEAEKLLNEKLKGADLNFMNLLVGKKGLDMK